MKLERVNENQIRCTLTKEDLEIRQLKISEIAYGSAKTKMLFKDVMQQASFELGFDAENIPLMIEAIPMSTGCVVFIITKVDNPEELDTRFSRFAPSVIEDNEDSDFDTDASEQAGIFDEPPLFTDNPKPAPTANNGVLSPEAVKEFIDNVANISSEEDIFNLFKKVASRQDAANRSASKDSSAKEIKSRIYCFEDLERVGKACKILNSFFGGDSSLYKNPSDNKFYLLLEKGNYDSKDFLKVSNLMLEYSSYIKTTPSVVAHMKEHYKLMIERNAVQGMAQF